MLLANRELTTLAGGGARLLHRGRQLQDAGRLDLAVALVQFAVDGAREPADLAAAHALRVEVMRAKEAAEPSLMAKSIYRSVRLASEEHSSKL